MGGGGQYTRWDDHHMGKEAQYTNRKGTYGNRADSYREDHNS
jgi:hypothetical protein